MVYRARDRTTGAVVAIKLTAEGPEDAQAASHLFHLHHPDIAAVHATGRRGLLHYSVMELAQGRDLRHHTDPAALLPLATTVELIARVARALHYAHDRGILHGDVKPANIVFDPATGALKLTDFGTGAGTPGYLAPERFCGLPASTASDQFALGVTLYQLACGRLPFTGRSRPEIAARVVHEPPTPIIHHLPDAPAALAECLDRALARTARARYPDALAFARAVEAARPHCARPAAVRMNGPVAGSALAHAS